MALSRELISQFAKIASNKTKAPTETTVYGTTVIYNGKPYVKLDGSDLLTPVNTTSSVSDGDRVTVMIKNHTATVTGNASDPSASSFVVNEQGSQINEFETIVAYKVSTKELEAVNATIENLSATIANIDNLNVENLDAINADIENLRAKYANLDYVNAKDVTAINAEIENLIARIAKVDSLTTKDLDAINAEIDNLKGYTADFTYVSADILSAFKASIKDLEANKITTVELDAKYANIDFSNIGQAAIEKFLSESGIIEDLVVSEGHVTGKLVGVTIVGDLIEGGTVVADKLVVLGTDGLYYKLNTDGVTTSSEQTEYNSLSGKIITAKSITAEKVNVTDLVAFDATIAGLNLTEGSIYSGVKTSVHNTTRGFYLDKNGQMALGDASHYLKYYKDQYGEYKLAISAESIVLKAGGKSLEDALNDIEIGGTNLIRHSINMIFPDYYFDTQTTPSGDYLADEFGNILFDEYNYMLIV